MGTVVRWGGEATAYQCADSLIKYSAGQSKPGVQDGHGQGEVEDAGAR